MPAATPARRCKAGSHEAICRMSYDHIGRRRHPPEPLDDKPRRGPFDLVRRLCRDPRASEYARLDRRPRHNGLDEPRGGVSYVVSPSYEIDLAATLDLLNRELGPQRLALEGGGGVNAAFFVSGLVDELSALIAPALDGTSDSRSLIELGPTAWARPSNWRSPLANNWTMASSICATPSSPAGPQPPNLSLTPCDAE